MKTTNPVDAARIELMLSDLRLPAIKAMWAKFAEQSDKEGWPAARFLAALAEHEIADRGRRRIERHLAEATIARRQDARKLRLRRRADGEQGAGDGAHRRRQLARKGRQSLVVRPARRRQEPSRGSHRPRARRERMARLVHAHQRSRPAPADRSPRTRPRKRARQARQVSPADPRRHRLRQQGSSRDQRAVRADRNAATSGAQC